MGVRELFRHGAALNADRLCLDDGVVALTYAEVSTERDRLVRAIRASASPRARCALLSSNCAMAMVAILAIYEADGVFVPLNAALSDEEHRRTMGELGIEVLFYDSAHGGAVAGIAAAAPALRLVVRIDGLGAPDPILSLRSPAEEPGSAPRDPHEVTAIYPTGGSTGRPKRVQHTRLIWETMAASFLTSLPPRGPVTYLMAPPITHAAGTFSMMLMPTGATSIIHAGVDPGRILADIERRRVTHLFLPPTAIYKLLEHPSLGKYDYSSLEAFIYTAAPMSVEKLRQCMAVFGPVMVQFWGQMEAPSFLTCLSREDHVAAADNPDLLGSCGRETIFTRVEVMDEGGQLLPAGERGELVVRGNLVMAGYLDNPEATAAVSEHGWHHTGDVGYKDSNGYVYIVGRKSDMIITGGFNVYPADIEQVLWAHPDVEECAVIGVPDELWGEAVVALVQPKSGRSVEAEALRRYCREKLGGVRAPKRVELRDDLPRTAVGKIDKPALRAPFWAGRARGV